MLIRTGSNVSRLLPFAVTPVKLTEPKLVSGRTLEEIVAYLKEKGIATFKLPERLEIRDELPRNPLGKILKRELRDELR